MKDSTQHQLDRDWTEDKLIRLQKYLSAYMRIFSTNTKAAYYTPIYIDAFAGTGYRAIRKQGRDQGLFPELAEKETAEFLKGSARIALEIEPPFAWYIFIEQDPEYQKELERLKQQFASIADRIKILPGDANMHLKTLCAQINWKKTRAVFFLDPYGMQVEWSTIEAIAKTKAADLWLLFPLGMAVTRLLKKQRPPSGAWAGRLSLVFGTEDWKEIFYPKRTMRTLFGDIVMRRREANWSEIKEYFIDRLEHVFVKVANNPLVLRNSKNVPLFLLCFAASNPKKAKLAIEIAQNILKV